MSLESALDVHDIDVLEEVETQTASMGVTREWVLVRTVRGRAVQPSGGDTTNAFLQRGWKSPWVIMFLPSNDPGVTPSVNRLRFIDQDGLERIIDVKTWRNIIDVSGSVRYLCAEGDDMTQRPRP